MGLDNPLPQSPSIFWGWQAQPVPGRKLKCIYFLPPSPLSPERLSAGNHSAKLSKEMLHLPRTWEPNFLKYSCTSTLALFLVLFIPDLISVKLEGNRSLRSLLGVLTFNERLIKWIILLQTAGSWFRKSHLAVFRLFSCSHPIIFILGNSVRHFDNRWALLLAPFKAPVLSAAFSQTILLKKSIQNSPKKKMWK